MKRLNQLSERDFLSRFFAAFSLSFLIAAFCMPDRADMLPGLWRILSRPTLSSTNFFSLGGYAATFSIKTASCYFFCYKRIDYIAIDTA